MLAGVLLGANGCAKPANAQRDQSANGDDRNRVSHENVWRMGSEIHLRLAFR